MAWVQPCSVLLPENMQRVLGTDLDLETVWKQSVSDETRTSVCQRGWSLGARSAFCLFLRLFCTRWSLQSCLQSCRGHVVTAQRRGFRFKIFRWVSRRSVTAHRAFIITKKQRRGFSGVRVKREDKHQQMSSVLLRPNTTEQNNTGSRSSDREYNVNRL